MKRTTHTTRGFTLLEAVLSLLILSIGIAAVFSMVNHVRASNRSMVFQTNAVDAFASIAAEIRDAQCDYPASQPTTIVADPGLGTAIGLWAGTGGPVAGSLIKTVGPTDGSGSLPITTPPMLIEYRIDQVTGAGGVGLMNVTAFELTVRIREITGDPVRDNPALESGYWIRSFPATKICSGRLDWDPAAAATGGRGEYL